MRPMSPALEALRGSKADILFGSRFLDGRSKIPWFKRTILLPSARFVNQLLTGVKLSDAHNGFRILNRQAVSSIALTQDRMAHASEIVLLAKQQGLRIIEYPVKVVYREYGQGVGGGVKILKDLLVGKLVE